MNQNEESNEGGHESGMTLAPPIAVPHPLAQTLHDRAGESARETRNAVITLSAGSLGFFFLSLTSKADPSLSDVEVDAVVVALIGMAMAVFSGMWAAWSDARWSYCWARSVENHQPGKDHWENSLVSRICG